MPYRELEVRFSCSLNEVLQSLKKYKRHYKKERVVYALWIIYHLKEAMAKRSDLESWYMADRFEQIGHIPEYEPMPKTYEERLVRFHERQKLFDAFECADMLKICVSLSMPAGITEGMWQAVAERVFQDG